MMSACAIFDGKSLGAEEVVEACRFDGRQFVSDGAGKVGVDRQYVDSVGDSIDDALPRTMTAAEKLKIAQVIIRGRLYAVVNRLFGPKLSTEVLLHDVSVLKHLASLDAVLVRKPQTNVSLFGDASVNGSLFSRAKAMVFGQLERGPAFWAAYLAKTIHSSAGTALNRHTFSALYAVRLPLLFGQLFSVKTAASAAVFRVLTPVLSIRAKMARLERERLVALQAFELDACDLSFRTPVCSEIVEVALPTAETVGLPFVFDDEGLAALFAGLFVRHIRPLFVSINQYSDSSLCATSLSGVA